MVRILRIFRELTSSENDEIDALLNARSSDHVVTSRFNIPIRLCVLHRLKDGGWLNDEIINYYVELLKESNPSDDHHHSYYFYQTYFYAKLRGSDGNFCYENVQRWNKDVNVFCFKKIFVPLHVHGDHWALAVIDMANKTICYIDSLKSNDDTFRGLEILNMWLYREAQRVGVSESFDNFNLVSLECPQQDNCSDCGIFLLTFMHLMHLNEDINLMEQSLANFMRRKVALSLMRGILQVSY